MSAITDPLYDPPEFKPEPRSAFGPIISAVEVEQIIAGRVRIWIRDYLAEIERQRGLEPERIPPLRSIVASGYAAGRFPEDQLPSLTVASSGIEPASGGRLEVHGDGGYTARFRVHCTVTVAARGNRLALQLVRLYTAAVRALLVQPRKLPPLGEVRLRRIEWTGEDWNVLDQNAERTQATGTVQLIVEVGDVVNRFMGPSEPRFEPSPPFDPVEEMLLGEVESSHVTVTKEEEE